MLKGRLCEREGERDFTVQTHDSETTVDDLIQPYTHQKPQTCEMHKVMEIGLRDADDVRE